ncbi:MAG TPA: hypothetical protein VK661_08370 [Planctomycetota bacterium]|nr:hypothetical protein [Planctomycetota bacterium]
MRTAGLALAAVLVLPSLLGAQDDLASAEKDFKSAIQTQAAKPLEDAIRKLVRINNAAAAKVLIGGLKSGNDTGIYWMLVSGATAFSSPDALKEVTKYIIANKSASVGRDLTSGLSGNFTDACESALVAILKEGTVDLQVLAVEHMMDVGQKASVEAVLEALREGAKSPELARRLYRVLNVLCVESYGETLSNWEGWWNSNKQKDWSLLRAKPQGSKGGGTGTVCDDLGKHRDSEYEKLKTGKILVIGAKTGCPCKQNHDLDNMETIAQRMKLQVDYITKLDFAKDACKPEDYVAILCNCTHLEKHCICPKCRKNLGGEAGLRVFQ